MRDLEMPAWMSDDEDPDPVCEWCFAPAKIGHEVERDGENLIIGSCCIKASDEALVS